MDAPQQLNQQLQSTSTQRSNARRIRLRRTVALCGVGVLIISGVFLSRYTSAPTEVQAHSILETTANPAEASPIAWPDIEQGAIATTRFGVLETFGEQQPQPIASCAKLITALTVLSVKPMGASEPGETLTLSEADVAGYKEYVAVGGSTTPVRSGMQLSQYEALQAILIASSNNVADSLALWAFGSMDAYHAAANELLAELGLQHTRVGGDASGLDPQSVSTAAELAVVSQAALQHPVIAEIAAQKQAQLPLAGTILSTNTNLGKPGVIGLKTGTSFEAGAVYILAGEQHFTHSSQTIITVMMGADDKIQAKQFGYSLFLAAQERFSEQQLLSADQPVVAVDTPWPGEQVLGYPREDFFALLWQNAQPEISQQYSSLSAKATAAAAPDAPQQIGAVTVSVHGQTTEIPVEITQPLPPSTLYWRVFARPW